MLCHFQKIQLIRVKLFQRLGISSLFFSAKDKRLATSIQLILGSKPFNLALYRLALTPAGLGEEINKGFRKSNERLEFLGDAILGAVIAEYLFKKYPYRDEGFLTETRSKLVNRETLNEVGIKIGLKKTLQQVIDNRQFVANKSLYGEEVAQGKGETKKKAEQEASKNACEKLQIAR